MTPPKASKPTTKKAGKPPRKSGASAKKTAAKRAPAKKTAVKKSTAKKAVAKKTAAKKTGGRVAPRSTGGDPPAGSRSTEDGALDGGAKVPADAPNGIAAALAELLDSTLLQTNASAADATIDALGLEDDDPKKALAVLVRRLARMLDADPSNAAMVREYRQAVMVLIEKPEGGDGEDDALERIREQLAGG